MKKLPPIAGWPIQTAFIHEPGSPKKKQRANNHKSSKK
jgi:hypothetical protein